MLASVLILVSAIIIGLQGLAHLVVTYVGPKLLPRDPSTVESMKQTSIVLSRDLNTWSAWIGFNASHSIGAILYATAFGYLSTIQSEIFFASLYLQVVGLLTLCSLLVIAKLHWFRGPLVGILMSLLLYVTGLALA